MRKIITIISFVLLAISCNQTNKTFLISNESIGEFKYGITFADVQKLVPQKQLKRVMKAGEFQDEKFPIYQYLDSKNTHLLNFIPAENGTQIERIEIISPMYKTKAGWGVGATFEEVKKSTKIIKAVPDMNVIHIQTENPKLWLEIDKQDLRDGWWNEENEEINLEKIHSNTKIIKIYKSIK